MPYKIKLESFEGPLDLLLFLIKKEEIDIYDIPIARITEQFLAYVEIIQLLDLEAASDFILMAATLMRIKAQLLLPRMTEGEEVEEFGDPRQELVHRLLEYKRFKEVAEDLSVKEDIAAKIYPRGSFKFEEGWDDEFLASSEVTLFDLVAAFRSLSERAPKVTVHEVQLISVTLEERIEYVERIVFERVEVKFHELFLPGEDKIVWIVTFIAILELIRSCTVVARQDEPFAEIYLTKADE
ncbi:MAG TPA: segregation/condensation protein A [bacterium]|nr:segregation/condensation protein A [bacterium]HPN34688.1 segregation/condensation protein A [bacterium]